MTLTIDENNDKISNTKFVWDDKKMVYKLSFDYTFYCNSGLTVHYDMTINEVSFYHDPTDGSSFLMWNGHVVFDFIDEDTIYEEELDDGELDMLDDEESDVYYAQSYDDYAEIMMEDFLENGIPNDVMNDIIFNIVNYDSSIPKHKVSFFKKLIEKMRGDHWEENIVKTVVTSKEEFRQD